MNIYIVYEINVHTTNYSYPTLENCLFGAVTLNKNADIDMHRHADRYGQNVIIFGVDMSFTIHIDNKRRTY